MLTFQQLLPPPTWKRLVTTAAVLFEVVLKSLRVVGLRLSEMVASKYVGVSWTFVTHTAD
jgi:hypothetical protein